MIPPPKTLKIKLQAKLCVCLCVTVWGYWGSRRLHRESAPFSRSVLPEGDEVAGWGRPAEESTVNPAGPAQLGGNAEKQSAVSAPDRAKEDSGRSSHMGTGHNPGSHPCSRTKARSNIHCEWHYVLLSSYRNKSGTTFRKQLQRRHYNWERLRWRS